MRTFSVLAASGLLLLGCGDDEPVGGGGAGAGGSGGEGGGGAPICYELAEGGCVEETFANPPVLEPNADGVYELELEPTEFMVDGKRHCGRGYNGMYPAPTIDTPANDGEPRQVRVNLRNRFTKSDVRDLSSEECTCVDSVSGDECEPMGHHGESDTCVCTTESGIACHYFDFNVTNLHAHGSHVRPDYAAGAGCDQTAELMCRACAGGPDDGPRECYFSDDVLSRVGPGEGVQHRWDIDEDGEHHEGLNWYHPHIHGSTAIQVASGATGAWIVRGPTDEMPGIADARERVMVISTPPVGFPALEDGEPCDEDHLTFNDFAVLGDTSIKQRTLINGIDTPRLVMAPGQIERWRFLHGAFLDEVFIWVFRGKDAECEDLDLLAPPVRLTQIGRDGLALPRPESGQDWPFAPDYMFMSPGYRIDALLDGNELEHGDTLCLVAGRFLQEDPTGTTPEGVGLLEAPTPEDLLEAATNGDVIAIVNVTDDAGPPTETEMPDLEEVAARSPSMDLQGGAVDGLARCEAAQATTDLAEIDQLSALWMFFANTEGYDQCGCYDHNINCENFELADRERYPYDRVFEKGAVDHWRIVSGFDGHPFHIHINPFLVCPLPEEGADDPNEKGRIFEPPFAHWRDTYLVNLDRVVDMVTEYRGFTGSYVYHCHKLNHEDHGMMELVRICDPETEACGELCDGGPCDWRSCAPGDESCLRALALTECLLDPSRCPEALVRCAPCGEDETCPPETHCREEADGDGITRCAPGCVASTDCPITDACNGEGECVAAPCEPLCLPLQTCVHGSCQ